MGRNRLFTDEQFIEAVQQYNHNVYQIATALECTQATVWNHAKRLGINFSKHKFTIASKNTMPLFNAYRGLKSVKELAKEFNASASTIYRLLLGAIDLYWETERAPVWPAPRSIAEIKVFHYFDTPPVHLRGWDDDDTTIATYCNIQPRFVAAYRTRCSTQPTTIPEPITQQIRRRTRDPEEGSLSPSQVAMNQAKMPLDQKKPTAFSKARDARDAQTKQHNIPSKVTDNQKKKSI